MAKTKKEGERETKSAGGKLGFEERLERLEALGEEIRRNDIPLDDAIKAFEEGVKLARALEKDLERVESRVEILMNGAEEDPRDEETKPVLGLFDGEE